MEQENNATNGRVDAPVVEPEQDKMMAKPVAEDNKMTTGTNEKKKGGNGMLIGLVLCVIAAVAGIGFGVWAMMDGNNQKNSYEEQISEMRQRNNDLQAQVSDLEAQVVTLRGEAQQKQQANNNIWPVTALLVGNEVHFINGDGETVKKDNFYSFVGIKKCTVLEDDKVLRCEVETTIDVEGDDDRGIIYYGEDGKIEHWSASGV